MYLQQHYGTKIYVSASDWNFMENPAGKKGPANLPKHDQVLAERQAVTLGGEKFWPVAVPGHTPGSMGFIFEVEGQGQDAHRRAVRRNDSAPAKRDAEGAASISRLNSAFQGGDEEA